MKTLIASSAALLLVPAAAHATTNAYVDVNVTSGSPGWTIQPGQTGDISFRPVNVSAGPITGPTAMVGWIDVSELTVTGVEASDGVACTTSAPTPFANGMAVQIKCLHAMPPTLPVDDHYAHPWWTPGDPDDPYAPTVVVHVRAAMYVQGETAYPTFNAFYNGDDPDIYRGGYGPLVHVPNLHTFLRADIGAPAMLQLGQTGTVGVTAINPGDGFDDLAGTLTLSGQASDTALQITDASIEGVPCQITHGATDAYTCSLDDVHLSTLGRLATAELHVRAAQPSAGSDVNAHASFSTAVNDDWFTPTASIIIPVPQPAAHRPAADGHPADRPAAGDPRDTARQSAAPARPAHREGAEDAGRLQGRQGQADRQLQGRGRLRAGHADVHRQGRQRQAQRPGKARGAGRQPDRPGDTAPARQATGRAPQGARPHAAADRQERRAAGHDQRQAQPMTHTRLPRRAAQRARACPQRA